MRVRRFHPNPCLFIGFSAVIACTAQPLQNGQHPPGSDSSVAPGTTGGNSGTDGGPRRVSDSGTIAPLCDALPASAVCSQNPTGSVALQSMSDLVTAMTGRWILCGQESVFAVGGGDIGLEITADNHWYKLFPAEGAAAIRGAGWDEEGTWTALDLGDHFQVNFNISGSGTVITAPVFASTPRAMRLVNNGVYVGNYVIDPNIPTGSVRCAPQPGSDGAVATGGTSGTDGGSPTMGDSGAIAPLCDALPASAVCSQNPTGSVAVQSMSDLVTAMTGKWILCGQESVFGVGGGDIGLEITADNHWFKLFPAEGAATIRGAGWDEEGTWTALGLGDHFQVNFAISGSGTVITAPVFASTPRAMRLDNNGVYVGNYVVDPNIPAGSVRCASPPGRG